MSAIRFQKFVFKNGKVASNRLVIPPMASGTADQAGFATQATFDHYQRLSTASAGIVFVEYSYVHSSGRGEENQLAADSSDKEAGLAVIASIIRSQGSLAGLQIVHAGGKSNRELTNGKLMSASAISVPVKGTEMEVPRVMSFSDIEDWQAWFFQSAELAARAGFDFVELHAAHGYGLNQWLSPLTNQRKDSFGGSLAGRSRLLFSILEKIKLNLPELLVSVRIPGQDHLSGGLGLADTIWLAEELERRGLDLLDVSSGIGGWRRPEAFTGEGYLVADATAIKSRIKIPVIGVGGIETETYIERAIRDSKIDFAAVGRAILKDPGAWFRNQHSELILNN
jgi:NADPH2 dehydrogenase